MGRADKASEREREEPPVLAMVDFPEFTSHLQARSQILSGALCEALSGFGESIVQKPDSALLGLEGEHHAHICDGHVRA